jgi:hypothetical protein
MARSAYSHDRGSPFAVVLGTNEIASAIAVALQSKRISVVLSHDPFPPVIRRKMAFHDALYDDPVTLGGVTPIRVDSGFEILSNRAGPSVMITELGLLDLIVIRRFDVLIDARMQKYQPAPDLRRLAGVAIGVGPGFAAGQNCDVAVETHPARVGRIIHDGSTDAPDRTARGLGRAGAERFVYASNPGRWRTAADIGFRMFKNFTVGHLDGIAVTAPLDGVLRGVVRDGIEVSSGMKLLEIDPRGRRACLEGLDERGWTIGRTVTQALSKSTIPRVDARPSLYVVK